MLSDFFFEPPKKRKFFQKIKYSLLKKVFLIKWFLISNIKYYIRVFFIRNTLDNNNIFILLLSKNRAEKFKRLLNSINILSKKKNRIKILVLLDEDEKMKEEYISISEDFKKKDLSIEIFFKNFHPYSLGMNFLAKKIRKEGLLCIFSDDLIITMNGWDDYIDYISSKLSKKKAFSIWTRSDAHTEKYYTFVEHPIVNSLWFKALGYIYEEKFSFLPDLQICELGRISGNFIITKKIIYKHLRATEYSEEKDETYLNLKKFREGENYNWFPEWKKNENKRIEDANKIKNLIYY